jgi:D-serine deaminase-like pyridoxal phosphate-dependent protein
MDLQTLPTPALVIRASTVRRNLQRMAEYAASPRLSLRPHTKTHKCPRLARMQMEHGAVGLTVAKLGEAQVMAEAAEDITLAYPALDPYRAAELAELARERTIRVGIDSTAAADALSEAARSAGSTLGVLVDLDVGQGRTGVQSPEAALDLARHIDRQNGLRLDGLIFFPGHVGGPPAEQGPALERIDALLGEVIDRWKQDGLEAAIVSGGSTPTAYQSHRLRNLTEIRPGTYIFNDANCVHGGYTEWDNCAARILCTVVSDAVPDQVIVDAGSKTLTGEPCRPAPDSGHGLVLEHPGAKIHNLSEEHGQVDVSACDPPPRLGERLSVIPNHVCPCVNRRDELWWEEGDGTLTPLPVAARGMVT